MSVSFCPFKTLLIVAICQCFYLYIRIYFFVDMEKKIWRKSMKKYEKAKKNNKNTEKSRKKRGNLDFSYIWKKV